MGRYASIILLLLALCTSAAFADRVYDPVTDVTGDKFPGSKLAEFMSFDFSFNGPDYVTFLIEVGESLPEKTDLDISYLIDFGVDPSSAENTAGTWKPEMTLVYRPYGGKEKFKVEGGIEGLTVYFIADFKLGLVAKLQLQIRGLRNDWFCRMAVRSVVKSGEKVASDIMDPIWFYPRVTDRPGGSPIPDVPEAEVIDPKLGDEMGKKFCGLYEFSLGEERGLLEITRRNGKYWALVAKYSGEVSEGPLYILKVTEQLKPRPSNTIASLDIAFRMYHGWQLYNDDPRPTFIVFRGFTGAKVSSDIRLKVVRFTLGELLYSDEDVTLSFIKVDGDPKMVDRREYLNRLMKDKYITDPREAYSAALSMFNAIASEDWGPGLELERLGGFEVKQYLARRMIRLIGMVDSHPECTAELRERALQLRHRIFTHVQVKPVLTNEDVARAARVPVLVYIFPKTEAWLDLHYKMEAQFSPAEMETIRKGLTRGAEDLFNSTWGWFAPIFDYYHDRKDAVELPPVDKMGLGNQGNIERKGEVNEYMLLLENMMRYTIYPNAWPQNAENLTQEEYDKLGLRYPVIFVIGKISSKHFGAMTKTRSQSEPALKNAKLVTGVAYTKGIERGRPGFCHIVLDDGFKDKDIADIVYWAMVLLMMDNTYYMKDQLSLSFLSPGETVFPDPYKSIDKFKAELGTEAWWNIMLNVYWTHGLRQVFAFGRRPWYLDSIRKNPQILNGGMLLGHEQVFEKYKDRWRK